MSKLCVIGNSHLGALKRAWDGLIEPEFKKKLDITFYAARGLLLDDMELDGRCLVPATSEVVDSIKYTSGGSDRVDLDLYDSFLIYGLDIRPYFFDDRFFYSDQVITQSLADWYDVVGWRLIVKIRKYSNRQIYVGHNPLRSDPNRDHIKNVSSDYPLGIELANRRFFGPLNALLVSQPEATIAGDYRNTRSVYAKGSKRLDVGDQFDSELHSEHDFGHMNDEFGKIWLVSFMTNQLGIKHGLISRMSSAFRSQ